MKKTIILGALMALVVGTFGANQVSARKEEVKANQAAAVQQCKVAYNASVATYYDALKAGRQAQAESKKAAAVTFKEAVDVATTKEQKTAARKAYNASIKLSNDNWKTAAKAAHANLEAARAARKACVAAAKPSPSVSPTVSPVI